MRFLFVIGMLLYGQLLQAQPIKLLVMSKTNGFRHKSIPAGKLALQLMADQNNWTIDFTEDSLQFSSYKKLKQYDAIVFLLTTGNILGDEEESAFKKYIHKGGGFVGIHTATDTELDWGWYINMVGTKFKSHPKQQQAKFVVVDSTHPSTKHLPQQWPRFDELYNYTDTLSPNIHVLIEVDEASYTGGTMGRHHPMAWWQHFEGGRIFQTSLGHTDDSYKEEKFLQHIKGAILWAANKK
jgi:type 1 glutamine amidotransferase